MPISPIIDDDRAERAAVEAALEGDLAEFQKRPSKEIPKAPPRRTASQAADARAGRAEIAERMAVDNPSRKIMNAIDEHHHAVGGYLKAVEAHLTHLLYTTYLNDREAAKGLGNVNKAIQDARSVLDRRRTSSLGGRPGGDTYFGPELDALHKQVYTIETLREVHRERIKAARQLDRDIPLEDDGGIPATVIRRWRRQQLAEAERAPLSDEVTRELNAVVSNVVNAARQKPLLLPQSVRIALIPPASEPALSAEPIPTAARHVDLCLALIENPDQPQAAFVKRFRVHPITVRRTRRELEEAGEIPVLAHRHGPVQRKRHCSGEVA